MDLGIKNKVAAVSAASMGLGFAAAMELAREGARLAICSRDRKRIEDASRRISQETGAEVLPLVVDVSREDEAKSFVLEAGDRFGRLDILVTNAGGPPPGGLDQIALEDVKRAFDLTLLSAVTMIKTAIPIMRKNRWGRIVNILSITVKQPEPALLMSNAMRSGLLGFAKSISSELARENILVNNVAPGYTKTERLSELAEDLAGKRGTSTARIFKDWEDKIPMRRLGRPEELAKAIAFLSSEAAGYITGVTLQVDGGFVQGLF